MQLFMLLALFANVFGQVKLRGSIDLSVSSNDESFHWREFTNFQERFSKSYSTIQELETRFEIFRQNFISILSHNADVNQNFTMGVNQFTDLTIYLINCIITISNFFEKYILDNNIFY